MQNKQHKIDFIIEKCGGDSIQKIMAFCNCPLAISEFAKYIDWEGGKEAKLQDQSDECINSLAIILGYENDRI
jgi:hypothetical protein